MPLVLVASYSFGSRKLEVWSAQCGHSVPRWRSAWGQVGACSYTMRHFSFAALSATLDGHSYNGVFHFSFLVLLPSLGFFAAFEPGASPARSDVCIDGRWLVGGYLIA